MLKDKKEEKEEKVAPKAGQEASGFGHYPFELPNPNTKIILPDGRELTLTQTCSKKSSTVPFSIMFQQISITTSEGTTKNGWRLTSNEKDVELTDPGNESHKRLSALLDARFCGRESKEKITAEEETEIMFLTLWNYGYREINQDIKRQLGQIESKMIKIAESKKENGHTISSIHRFFEQLSDKTYYEGSVTLNFKKHHKMIFEFIKALNKVLPRMQSGAIPIDSFINEVNVCVTGALAKILQYVDGATLPEMIIDINRQFAEQILIGLKNEWLKKHDVATGDHTALEEWGSEIHLLAKMAKNFYDLPPRRRFYSGPLIEDFSYIEKAKFLSPTSGFSKAFLNRFLLVANPIALSLHMLDQRFMPAVAEFRERAVKKKDGTAEEKPGLQHEEFQKIFQGCEIYKLNEIFGFSIYDIADISFSEDYTELTVRKIRDKVPYSLMRIFLAITLMKTEEEKEEEKVLTLSIREQIHEIQGELEKDDSAKSPYSPCELCKKIISLFDETEKKASGTEQKAVCKTLLDMAVVFLYDWLELKANGKEYKTEEDEQNSIIELLFKSLPTGDRGGAPECPFVWMGKRRQFSLLEKLLVQLVIPEEKKHIVLGSKLFSEVLEDALKSRKYSLIGKLFLHDLVPAGRRIADWEYLFLCIAGVGSDDGVGDWDTFEQLVDRGFVTKKQLMIEWRGLNLLMHLVRNKKFQLLEKLLTRIILSSDELVTIEIVDSGVLWENLLLNIVTSRAYSLLEKLVEQKLVITRQLMKFEYDANLGRYCNAITYLVFRDEFKLLEKLVEKKLIIYQDLFDHVIYDADAQNLAKEKSLTLLAKMINAGAWTLLTSGSISKEHIISLQEKAFCNIPQIMTFIINCEKFLLFEQIVDSSEFFEVFKAHLDEGFWNALLSYVNVIEEKGQTRTSLFEKLVDKNLVSAVHAQRLNIFMLLHNGCFDLLEKLLDKKLITYRYLLDKVKEEKAFEMSNMTTLVMSMQRHKKGWVLLEKMIEEKFLQSTYLNSHIIYIMAANGQYQLISRLLEKNLLKKEHINADVIERIVRCKHFSLLEALLDKELLQKAHISRYRSVRINIVFLIIDSQAFTLLRKLVDLNWLISEYLSRKGKDIIEKLVQYEQFSLLEKLVDKGLLTSECLNADIITKIVRHAQFSLLGKLIDQKLITKEQLEAQIGFDIKEKTKFFLNYFSDGLRISDPEEGLQFRDYLAAIVKNQDQISTLAENLLVRGDIFVNLAIETKYCSLDCSLQPNRQIIISDAISSFFYSQPNLLKKICAQMRTNLQRGNLNPNVKTFFNNFLLSCDFLQKKQIISEGICFLICYNDSFLSHGSVRTLVMKRLEDLREIKHAFQGVKSYSEYCKTCMSLISEKQRVLNTHRYMLGYFFRSETTTWNIMKYLVPLEETGEPDLDAFISGYIALKKKFPSLKKGMSPLEEEKAAAEASMAPPSP